MEEFFVFVEQHIFYAPFIICGLLLLAGLNIPVSEDAMIFISATLAAKYANHLIPLFIGVFLGAYFSDIICFYLGRFFGPHIFKIRFFKKMMNPEKVDWFKSNIEKYGIFALIIGRFIPFGVRNGIFLTCGITRVSPVKFSFYDFVATVISVSLYFTLYYHIGPPMIEIVKKFNVVIFAFFIIGIIIYLIVRRFKKRLA